MCTAKSLLIYFPMRQAEKLKLAALGRGGTTICGRTRTTGATNRTLLAAPSRNEQQVLKV